MALNTLGIIKNGTKIKIPAVFVPEPQESVSVTADGVKTYRQIIYQLQQLIDWSKINRLSALQFDNVYYANIFTIRYSTHQCSFCAGYTNANGATVERFFFEPIESDCFYYRSRGTSMTDLTFNVPSSGTVFTLYY